MKRVDLTPRSLAASLCSIFAAVALLTAGCNADTLSGPDYGQATVIQKLGSGFGEMPTGGAATLGGKHESRNENGLTTEAPATEAAGGKHESRNENGAAGGKHESRNENG